MPAVQPAPSERATNSRRVKRFASGGNYQISAGRLNIQSRQVKSASGWRQPDKDRQKLAVKAPSRRTERDQASGKKNGDVGFGSTDREFPANA